MSLETEIGRLIVALEANTAAVNKAADSGRVTPAPATEAPNKGKAAKNAAPAAAPVLAPEPEFDPFNEGQPEITTESLKTLLTLHSQKYGPKVTIVLIKKHGADQLAPKISTIPQVNWAACYAEAEADLKKLETKKGA